MPKAVVSFVSKLWRMLSEANGEHIFWSEDGGSFYIAHGEEFAAQVLPVYYAHANLSSFIRQLNLYGFRKAATLNDRLHPHHLHYHHHHFHRERPDELRLVRRKGVSSRSSDGASSSGASNNDLVESTSEAALDLVRSVSDAQDAWDERVVALKSESEDQSDELAQLVSWHSKQRLVVNKLLTFFSDSFAPLDEEGETEEEEEDEDGPDPPKRACPPSAIVATLEALQQEIRLAVPLRPVGGWPEGEDERRGLTSLQPLSKTAPALLPSAPPSDFPVVDIVVTRASAQDFADFLSRVETSLGSIRDHFAPVEVAPPEPHSVPHRLAQIFADLPSVMTADSMMAGASAGQLPVGKWADASLGVGVCDAERSPLSEGSRPLFSLPAWDLEDMEDDSTDASSSLQTTAHLSQF